MDEQTADGQQSAVNGPPSMVLNNEVKYCGNCEEITPITSETAGPRCQICGEQSSYSADHAIATVDDTWLALFWRAKFYELNNGNSFQLVIKD